MDLMTNLPALYWYYLATNTISLLLYVWDKMCAVTHRSRISEHSLHLSTFMSGGLGALLGQFMFRHKIRKPSFFLIALLSLITHGGLILVA